MFDDSTGKLYFTLAEIEATGLMSHSTLWRQIQNGKLEAIQVGRSLRVPKASLDAFIEEHRVKASTKVGA